MDFMKKNDHTKKYAKQKMPNKNHCTNILGTLNSVVKSVNEMDPNAEKSQQAYWK